jgi:hypothetical protein
MSAYWCKLQLGFCKLMLDEDQMASPPTLVRWIICKDDGCKHSWVDDWCVLGVMVATLMEGSAFRAMFLSRFEELCP